MAKLDSEKRNKISSSEFGLPSERKYPIEDKSHARNAKARASEEEHKGHISKGQEEEIDSKADKKLGKSRDKKAMGGPMSGPVTGSMPPVQGLPIARPVNGPPTAPPQMPIQGAPISRPVNGPPTAPQFAPRNTPMMNPMMRASGGIVAKNHVAGSRLPSDESDELASHLHNSHKEHKEREREDSRREEEAARNPKAPSKREKNMPHLARGGWRGKDVDGDAESKPHLGRQDPGMKDHGKDDF